VTHQATVLRGLIRLAFDAGVALTDIVESMHRNISRAPGIIGTLPDGPTTGLTGLIYQGVKNTIRLAGGGVDAVLEQLGPMLGDAEPSRPRDAMLSVLNGIVGDHLVATGNPLAIQMRLRVNGMPLQLKRRALAAEIFRPNSRVLILVHGLCLNERQWNRKGHDHGTALARDLGYTPLYLHYNTGLHISTNGRAFAEMLDVLVKQWPVPIEELSIIGHSMGGLVARSACHYAMEAAQAWRPRLHNLIFLGTPHHGVPLERGGQWVDSLIGKSPYTAPFTRLGRIRSAGITDLRYGNVVDEDWEGHDRFNHAGDTRQVVPLPPGVRCHAIAGTASQQVGGEIIGDGLVPVGSALGQHEEPSRDLALPKSRQRIARSINHMELLNRPEVYKQIRKWLRPLDSQPAEDAPLQYQHATLA
jgi:pimeloyl-ACP methyl ester carboxylesterase